MITDQKQKIDGYVICQPIETWGNKTLPKWYCHHRSFGTTPTEAWSRWLCIGYGTFDWDRKINFYMNRGYRIKKATLIVDLEPDEKAP